MQISFLNSRLGSYFFASRYVSLGKVESVLKGCPVVGNVCVYGDSSKSYVVAVVCPVPATLKEIADKFGKSNLGFEAQCKDKDVTGAVLREVSDLKQDFKKIIATSFRL